MPDMNQFKEERAQTEKILKTGSKAAKLGLARGLRNQAKFLRIQAAAGNVVELVLPATGKIVAGVTAELARSIADSFDGLAEILEKSASEAPVSKILKSQSPGTKGDMEWKIMDKVDFLGYLKKLDTKNKERSAELFAAYEKWKKEGYSDEDAVRKAFASQHIKEIDERLDDLTYQGWDEEGFAKKKGNFTPKEQEILDEVMKLRRLKGHALTQHQKGRKFFRAGRNQEEQDRRNQEEERDRQEKEDRRRQEGERRRKEEEERQKQEEEGQKQDEKKRRKENEERHKEEMEQNKEKIKVIVDSQPMQEVHIRVEKGFSKQASSSIAPEEIARVLKIGNVDSWMAANRVERAMTAVSEFEIEIFKRIQDAKAGKKNAAGDLITIPTRDEAHEIARDLLRKNSAASEDLADLMLSKIFDPTVKSKPELYFLDLDEWRVQELGKKNGTTPFSIRRYTVYLASLNTLNEMRRRGEQAVDAHGNPIFGVHNWVDLDDKDLVRRLPPTNTPDRYGVVERNTFTYFELEAGLKPEETNNKETGDKEVARDENGNIIYNKMFRFTADTEVDIKVPAGTETKKANFDRWEIINLEPQDNNWVYDIMAANGERYVRSVQRGVVTHWENVLTINVKGRIKIVAYYKVASGTIKYNQRPGLRGPAGTGSNTGVLSGDVKRLNRGGLGSAAKNTAIAALGIRGIKDRLGREVKQRDLKKEWEEKKKNTLVLAAANKGKRILNRYGKAEYTRIFIRGGGVNGKSLRDEYRRRAQELKQLETAARTARNALRTLIRREGRHRWQQYTRRTNMDLINMADDARRERAEAGLAANVAMNEARDTLQTYLTSREKYFEDYKRDFEAAAAHLQNYLLGKAQTVSIELARRYRMSMNGEDEAALEKELQGYAVALAEDFASRGRTMGNAFMRGLGIMSRGTETFAAAGMNVIESTWDFVFGPWTWTTILALVQFFFVLSFIGYNLTYLWIFPLIAAGFTFLLNFSDSFRPLDWVTHISSGAIIGYSAMLLLVALGALNWSFMSPFVFWIVWAVLGFLGIMQFYQTGGWKVVVQGAVVIMIFAYIALGPYSAYYQQAIDQVKAPVEIAYRAVSGAVTDIWLLATNPTEWYARQQLVNVRPESPIDFPKGLEVTLLDALPPSVPGGREFALTTVIKNEGSIQKPALDASLSFGCNQWCTVPQPSLPQPVYSLCEDVDIFTRNEIYCAPTCAKDKVMAAGLGLDACVQKCLSEGSSNPLSVVGANNCVTTDVNSYMKSYGYVRSMERGEAKSISVRGFTAISQPGRQGETRLAEVTVNLSYRYSTSTSLLTEVMAQSEIDRKIQENENVYRNVLAVTKSSPAQLSLNVGPQPLTAGQTSLLLVSVSNTRDESSIVLKRGTLINIKLPKVVGTGLECEGIRAIEDATKENELLAYRMPQDVTVLPYNFQSIFAFLCNFRAADPAVVGDVKSALITAEMPDYTFVLTKKKQVPVTPPLGVLFDPYEYECNKCEDSISTQVGNVNEAFLRCTEADCYKRDNLDSKKGKVGECWYEFSDKEGAFPVSYFSNRCHSCANRKCEEFLTEGDCNVQAKKCGLPCEWDKDASHPLVIEVNKKMRDSHLDPTDGACKDKAVKGAAIASCSSVPASYVSSYNRNKDKIATQLSVFPLDGVSNPQALVAALISKESGKSNGWDERASRNEPQINDASYGLMQIVPSYHPECDKAKITSYDVDENLKCGIRYLARNLKDCGGSIEGALRKYNSGSCTGTTFDPDYVPHILGTKTDNDFSSGYAQWSSCFSPAVVVGKGSDNYCQQKLAATQLACDKYEGGCKSDGECITAAAGPNPVSPLICRTGVASVGICCYTSDTDAFCTDSFNRWVSAP